VVICVISLLAAILFPVFSRATEKAWQTSCGRQMANLSAALRVYSADYFGHFPPEPRGLQALTAYVDLPRGLDLCPTALRTTGATVFEYVYRGGLCDDGDPNEVVLADPYMDLHNGGCNLLWLDGHIKWVTAKQVTPPGQSQLSAAKGLEEIRGKQQRLEVEPQ